MNATGRRGTPRMSVSGPEGWDGWLIRSTLVFALSVVYLDVAVSDARTLQAGWIPLKAAAVLGPAAWRCASIATSRAVARLIATSTFGACVLVGVVHVSMRLRGGGEHKPLTRLRVAVTTIIAIVAVTGAVVTETGRTDWVAWTAAGAVALFAIGMAGLERDLTNARRACDVFESMAIAAGIMTVSTQDIIMSSDERYITTVRVGAMFVSRLVVIALMRDRTNAERPEGAIV